MVTLTLPKSSKNVSKHLWMQLMTPFKEEGEKEKQPEVGRINSEEFSVSEQSDKLTPGGAGLTKQTDALSSASASKKVIPNHKPIPFRKNERVQSALVWLHETYPLAFHKTEKKPLKVGILQDIFLNLTEASPSKTAIRDALTYYTGSPSYQKAVLEQPLRYDLNGTVVGEVEEEQKAHATKRQEDMMVLLKERKEKWRANKEKHKQRQKLKAKKKAASTNQTAEQVKGENQIGEDNVLCVG
jgi:ProP effector